MCFVRPGPNFVKGQKSESVFVKVPKVLVRRCNIMVSLVVTSSQKESMMLSPQLELPQRKRYVTLKG